MRIRNLILIIFLGLTTTNTVMSETVTIPVLSSSEMPEMLEQFRTDRALFNRYFGRKNFKSSGRLLNIFGLALLNVYSANIVSPHGEINCTPAIGPEMEQLEYLYDVYTPGQPILVQGVINSVAFGTLMLTPCQVWTMPSVEELTPAANKGNSSAQYQLGEIYSFGLGMPIDLQVGLEWYRRAAAQGHAEAIAALKLFADREQHIAGYKAQMDRLAELARQERERIATYKAATVDQLYQTVNTGDPEAQLNLGRRYLEGDGVTKDEHLGIEYLVKAADQGNRRAMIVLRNAAVPGLISNGNPEAAFALGRIYATGQGVTINDMAALSWFKLAAEQNYPGAADLVKAQDAKVLELLQKDSANGDHQATLELAKRYLQPPNEDAEPNPTAALPLLIKATALGNMEALDILQNQAKPGWFSNGDAKAAFALGEIYFQGMGVDADHTQAAYWYQIAANQGMEAAKSRLADIEQQKNTNPQLK
ncbi:hypothetical protein TI04_08630 [Achromatium sp. WMS2]|nr:hypothetical protein TI04_08630 [Achromatium sp. WMS2]